MSKKEMIIAAVALLVGVVLADKIRALPVLSKLPSV